MGVMIIGAPFNSAAFKNKTKAIDMYNGGLPPKTAALNFGITQHGVGLVLEF
jgi:hypothetical protein